MNFGKRILKIKSANFVTNKIRSRIKIVWKFGTNASAKLLGLFYFFPPGKRLNIPPIFEYHLVNGHKYYGHTKLFHFAKCIQIIRTPQNQGIVNALNTGLQTLKTRTDYKYIARLDAGDICHPERFTKQIHFLDTHPDIFL